jgi:uncharacterized protein YukE
MSVWSGARQTFGLEPPQDGNQIDKSAQLRQLQSKVQSAAPSSQWTGSGSDAYAEANTLHARNLGALAALDQRLGAEIDRSAAVVTAGRRELEAVRQWVVGAASTVPRTAAGERILWPVVSKGTGEIADIIQRSHDELSAIAGRMKGIDAEYQALGHNAESSGGDEEPANALGWKQSGGGDEDKQVDVPETTLDLSDIVRTAPGAKGDPGMMELVPGSGVWVPDPRSSTYRPKRPEAPLDLNDIEYLGPGVKGNPGMMELVPGSGAWVPDPSYPGYRPHSTGAPVDLSKIEIVDPKPLIPSDRVELWPHSGILIPNPYLGRPF